MPDQRIAPSADARSAVRALAASQIREVANEGMGDPDILAFWFGEPDEVTPAFIRDAGVASLARGETFYTQNFGIPPLRSALAAYVTGLHRATTQDHIAVTASGMSALMLAVEALVAPGDRVVVVTPLWPNLVEIPKILSAHVECVPLVCDAGAWRLDLDRLLAALTPDTRVAMINSPNNPTGWTLTRAEQQAILDHCRRHGIWLVADDVYERLYYRDDARCRAVVPRSRRRGRARDQHQQFLEVMADDRLAAGMDRRARRADARPRQAHRVQHVLLSGIRPARGGGRGHAGRADDRAHARAYSGARATSSRASSRDCRACEVAPPPGAMYAFFRVEGLTDSLAFCKRLVREARLGLAPGGGFGPEGEGFVRWCFASDEARLADGVARLATYLRTRR